MSGIACKFYVLDAAYVRLGEVRSLDSVQWLEDYAAAGEVKLVCGATANNRRLLTRGAYLQNTERPHLLAVVCNIVIDDDLKTAKMTVRAQMSVAQWRFRTVFYTQNVNGPVEAAALRIAAENRRGLACGVGAAKGLLAAAEAEISWGHVLDALEKLCGGAGLGFRAAAVFGPDGTLTGEALELYEGVDRTDPAGGHYVGYFGDDVGNVQKLRLTDGDENYCNVAVVAGRGEGAAQRVVEASLFPGLAQGERRELYVNYSSVPEKYQIDAGGKKQDVAYTQAQIDGLMRTKGLEELAKRGLVFDVSAQIGDGMLMFGRDYELGDVLPLRVKRYDVAVAMRVQQVKFIYEKTGRTVQAVLKARD